MYFTPKLLFSVCMKLSSDFLSASHSIIYLLPFLTILFSERVHTQSLSPILYDPMDFNLPAWNFSRKNIKARCNSCSRGSFLSTDQKHIPCVSCIGRRILYWCTTWEAHLSLLLILNMPLSYWQQIKNLDWTFSGELSIDPTTWLQVQPLLVHSK